jgi:serine/threonine protein kinase
MAPEQIMGRAGTAADVFTWAVTVAFAAGGRTPFGTGASDAIMYRIVHEAPDISAVPPGLRRLVGAALAKDPQARPTAPQLLAELTNSQLTSPGYDNPTQTVLAQTWHPSATGPMGPAPVPTGQRFTGQGPTGPGGPRRRKALIPVVLALAFLLAAGGTALGLALAGQHQSPAASGSTTPPASSPAQPSSSAATTPTSPAASTTSPASTPVSTPPTTPASTPVSTTPAALPVLTVGSYTGMKPTEIAYSGDATNVVTKITWSSWTTAGASGQGTSDIDSCNPNCAQAPPSLVPTTVTLSAPVNGRFTKMTETRNGSTSTFTYPDNWPQSAS